MTIKSSLNDTHVAETTSLSATVSSSLKLSTTTISLAQLSAAERARDVRRFVVREYEWCDLVEHSIRGFACVANHVFPEPRRAAVESETEICRTRGLRISFESVLTLKNLM